MCTRLLAVAFDLLPSTFVACSRHSAPFLHMRGWLGAIELGGVGGCLRVLELGHDIIVARLDLAQPVVVVLRRCAFHGWRASPGQDLENDDLQDALKVGNGAIGFSTGCAARRKLSALDG
jgi:hypothetical protein